MFFSIKLSIFLCRESKIEKLCLVLGNDKARDPDKTYELTSDNVKKILAIYMRFRYLKIFHVQNLRHQVINYANRCYEISV